MTAAQLRIEYEKLKEKLEQFESYGYCYMCDTHKNKDKFYVSTDPMIIGNITPICKECSRKIALRVDKNGQEYEPTKESCQKALMYLNKPFLNTVWDASVQESENLISGKVKANVWFSYIKNIAMKNYIGLTYQDSDIFKPNPVNKYETDVTQNTETVIQTHIGQDVYDSYLKNKADVIRLLNYDPFEKESVTDQPALYSQLLGLLDASEDANSDMMRTSSAISIVRGFLQQSKIDDTISELMSNIVKIEKNSATIKSLQESKCKISSIITSLAEDSCISLKNNKNAKKGENTWTGKIKKIKELNLREGDINGFDMETCKAMRQVMDLSNASIMKQLHLDESEWSDIVAEQRNKIIELQDKLDKYIEISRILLRENLDIKDCLKEQSISLNMEMVNLNQLFSCFSEPDSMDNEDLDDEDN